MLLLNNTKSLLLNVYNYISYGSKMCTHEYDIYLIGIRACRRKLKIQKDRKEHHAKKFG